MDNRDNFFIILPSNVIADEYPGNTSSHYFTPLPKPLVLEPGRWEVALVGISYPFSWLNVIEPWNKIVFLNYITYNGEDEENIKKELVVGNDILNGYDYEQHKKVVPTAFYSDRQLLEKIESLRPDSYSSRFTVDKTSNKVTISLHGKEGIVFDKYFAELLGFGDNITLINRGFGEVSYEATRPVDLNPTLHAMYIYSNIVQDTLVGNVYCPLLRIVHVTGKYHAHVDKTFINPFYIDVSPKTISAIEVSLRDDQGTLINFLTGKVILKLHFRKKRIPIL